MKTILVKVWNFLKQKNHLLIVIGILFVLGLIATVYFQHKKIGKLTDQYQTETKLVSALLDSTAYYQNKDKEWVAEKLTLQETIKNLDKIKSDLTASEQNLLKKVEEIEKKNSIISAALIQTNVKIDSLLHSGSVAVDTAKKTLAFKDSIINAKHNIVLKYDITVGEVLPAFPKIKPTLMFNNLTFPNEQFVEFHWISNKKAGYPVSFSVTNSNDYFKTVNIDSYAIPAINKNNLNPTGMQKLGQWIIKNGKVLITGGVAAVGGAVIYHYVTK